MSSDIVTKAKLQLIKRLSSAPKTVYEARVFLEKKGVEIDEIDSIIEELEEKKFLDDRVYSRCWIEDRHSRKNYGPHRLKQELKKKNIDSFIIEEELEPVFCNRDKVLEKVRELIQNKVDLWDGKEYLKFKQKVYNYLIRLGYNSDMIIEAINEKVRNIE